MGLLERITFIVLHLKSRILCNAVCRCTLAKQKQARGLLTAVRNFFGKIHYTSRQCMKARRTLATSASGLRAP